MSVRHDVAVPRPTSFVRRQVAARRRRDVDEQLRAVEGEQLRHAAGARSPRRSRCPMPTPRRDGTARSTSPGGEEAALVEQPVGRQEHLAVDVADLAVLDQRGGDEQPVVGRLLDERHDGREAAGRRPASAASRGSSSRIATSAARSWSW